MNLLLVDKIPVRFKKKMWIAYTTYNCRFDLSRYQIPNFEK